VGDASIFAMNNVPGRYASAKAPAPATDSRMRMMVRSLPTVLGDGPPKITPSSACETIGFVPRNHHAGYQGELRSPRRASLAR